MEKLNIIPVPAIDLIDGKCVRLTQGDYATSRVYADNPIDMAKRFEAMGYKRLHLVDLDGARSKHVVNDNVLRGIVRETSLVVDFGGGVKTCDDMARVLDAGAAMVTCGSIAATQPDTVLGWIEQYGAERLILGADVQGRTISINGWQEKSTLQLDAFLASYMQHGLTHVLCTDISRDGMLQGPAIALYSEIMAQFPQCRLIASGGVSSIDDIITLNKAGIPEVVFGKAIYEGRIDMKELGELIGASINN